MLTHLGTAVRIATELAAEEESDGKK